MFQQPAYGTSSINVYDLNDSDTIGNIPPSGLNQAIKGTPVTLPESGMNLMEPEPQPQVQIHQPLPPPMSTNVHESECVKNARHCETCPICSRLYNNTTTYHNYAILFLLIVCIFLIKNLYSYHNRD